VLFAGDRGERSPGCAADADRPLLGLDRGQVTPIVGASGQLAQQIRQGAPFDIFLSANTAFVRDLAGEGLIEPDTVRPYARVRLILVVKTSVAFVKFPLEVYFSRLVF